MSIGANSIDTSLVNNLLIKWGERGDGGLGGRVSGVWYSIGGYTVC